MATKLFVGGLAYVVTDDQLRDLFATVGTVQSAQVIKDKYSGQSKGFGFVEMSTEEEAQTAIKDLNGKEIEGRAIAVNEARPQEPRENRSFGGGGGGGFRGGNDRRGGGGGGRKY
ncbi:MAG TPA: RNA-binding protein [Candidatus Saccharimonadales bacterium]|jgi:RNA recognition motif-containing protein|nr:RNA-binding protein [Candidatus Saccharimonadales bacterium]